MNCDFKLIMFLLIIQFRKVVDMNGPISPCPRLFQYRFDGSEWYGVLTLKNSAMNKVLHMRVILSLRGKPISTFLGDIELLTRGQTSRNASVVYKIRFPPSSALPRVTKIFVNNHIVCFGPPDHSVLTTVIQLEHTRKITFLSSDVTTGIQSSETINQSSSISPNNVDMHFLEDVCGTIEFPSTTKLVDVQGAFLSRGTWPWLAALYIKQTGVLSYHCAGTLVSSRVVLSAAHCFRTTDRVIISKEVIVSLGRYNLLNWLEEESLSIECDQIFIHPEFDMNLKTSDADIAAIVLEKSVRFSRYIRPICLWTGVTNPEYVEGEHGFVVGWGHDRFRPISPTPRKAVATIVSTAACLNSNKAFAKLVSNRTLCAGERNGTGPCNGDSGVGLIIFRKNKWTLRGIFSTSLTHSTDENLCNLQEFSVYTDITYFLDWIYALLI